MLTIDYDLLDVRPGMRVLDLGCGEGRHAFEAYRRGASVLAVDWGRHEVATTAEWLGAIAAAGEAPAGASPAAAMAPSHSAVVATSCRPQSTARTDAPRR